MAVHEVFLLSSIIISLLGYQALGQTCEPSWNLHSGVCYKHFNLQVDYSEAEQQCELEGGQLASNLTSNVIASLSEGQDEISSFWFSREEDEIYPPLIMPRPPPSRRKRFLVPDGPTRNCFYIKDKAEERGFCDDLRGYICEKNATLISNACLYENAPNGTDWYTAKEMCHTNGSDLYSYKDEIEERTALESMEGTREGMWIGLKRERNSNVFRWSDGSKLNYTNWAPGQPEIDDNTKLCVVHSAENLQWEVYDCNCSRSFICKPAEESTVMQIQLSEETTVMTSQSSEYPTTLTSQSSEDPTTLTSQSSEDPTVLTSQSSEDPTTMTSQSSEDPTKMISQSSDVPTTMTSQSLEDPTAVPRVDNCTLKFEYIYIAAAILGTTALLIMIFYILAKRTRETMKESRKKKNAEIPPELLKFHNYSNGVPNNVCEKTV